MTTEPLTTEPLAERVIADVETLRALSDPLRLRILEIMVARHREAWTVKRLAAELGVGQTKLYHHIKLLEERELIVAAGTRVVSGIIETSYRTAQLSLRLDRSLVADGTVPPAVDDLLRTVLDGVRVAIEAGIRSGALALDADAEPPRRLHLSRGIVRVPASRVADVHARFKAFAEELDGMIDEDEGSVTLGYVLGLYPLAAEEPAR